MARALAASEAFLSPTEWDMKNHNLLHLVDQIVLLGECWIQLLGIECVCVQH